jgi:hypothetical protein
MDNVEVHGNVIIRKRNMGEEWKTVQEIPNVITTYGKQFILDCAAGLSSGSVSYFEIGAGGRETEDAYASGGTILTTPFGTPTNKALAQTFYAGTGNVTRVSLLAGSNTGTPTTDIAVSLYSTSGTDEANPTGTVVPTGTALTTQYCRQDYWQPGSVMTFNTSSADIVVGSRYAVVISASGLATDGSNYNSVYSYSGTDTYTSGNCVLMSGTAWTVSESQDLYFKSYYKTFDNSPVPKTSTSYYLTIPTKGKLLTSSSRTDQTLSMVADLASFDANVPGKISEIRLMSSITGSGLSTVAFRDEDKDETIEMQIEYQWIM